MMRKPTETLWKLMDSGLTALESAWDWTKPSACGWQLCDMGLGLFMGYLAVGLESIPDAWAGFLKSIPYGEMPCSTIMLGKRAWSCLNLISQILLTLHRSPCPFWVVDGGGLRVVWVTERQNGGDLWLVCHTQRSCQIPKDTNGKRSFLTWLFRNLSLCRQRAEYLYKAWLGVFWQRHG